MPHCPNLFLGLLRYPANTPDNLELSDRDDPFHVEPPSAKQNPIAASGSTSADRYPSTDLSQGKLQPIADDIEVLLYHPLEDLEPHRQVQPVVATGPSAPKRSGNKGVPNLSIDLGVPG